MPLSVTYTVTVWEPDPADPELKDALENATVELLDDRDIEFHHVEVTDDGEGD